MILGFITNITWELKELGTLWPPLIGRAPSKETVRVYPHLAESVPNKTSKENWQEPGLGMELRFYLFGASPNNLRHM